MNAGTENSKTYTERRNYGGTLILPDTNPAVNTKTTRKI